ncbi:hypothetical protein LEMLEM_LOCUS11563, partial [Lemmus lemmus]
MQIPELQFAWAGSGAAVQNESMVARSPWPLGTLQPYSLLLSGGYSHLVSWLHHELEECSFIQQLYRVPKTQGTR